MAAEVQPMGPDGLGALDDLDQALDGFLVDLCRRTPGARVQRQDGLLLAIGAVPSPVIVNTMLPRDRRVDMEAIDRAMAVYLEVGHRATLFTRDRFDADLESDLRAAGWAAILELPGMVVEAPLPDAGPPPGVTLRTVEGDLDRSRWLEAGLAGFASDEDDRSAMRSAFATLGSLTGGPIAASYAEVDGRPVSNAMSWLDASVGVGVVGWVGTDPDYRRRGIGAAVTRAVTNAGFALGARLMSLQATPMGRPVYEKLGYRTVTGYKVWFKP